MPTLVIADDHELLREGLGKYAVARNAGISVVASVGDAQSAVNACRRHQPDLLVLDIEMPGRDALAAMSEVRQVSENTKIVILSAYSRDPFIDLAIRGGASGYILKCERLSTIYDSMVTILNDGSAFSQQISDRISRLYPGGVSEETPSCFDELTPRELEILRYIGRGLDNAMMAKAMSISRRTVERHVYRLMDAVGIRDRDALAELARKYGFVSENDNC